MKRKGLCWLTVLEGSVHEQLAAALVPVVRWTITAGVCGGASSSPHFPRKDKRGL